MNTTPALNLNAIHKTQKEMRIRLCDLQIKVMQTPFPSTAADELLVYLTNTLHYFEEHTHQEQEFVLAHLKKNASAMLEELEEEHEQEEDLIARVHYLIKRWRQSGKSQDAKALVYGLTDFTAFKLNHLNREAREMIPMLERLLKIPEATHTGKVASAQQMHIA